MVAPPLSRTSLGTDPAMNRADRRGIMGSSGREQIAPMLEVERVTDDTNSKVIAEWHREAMGYKIRYAPSALPDLLRTEAVRAFEFNAQNRTEREAREQLARDQLVYSRRPETDMEVCMPVQRLEQFSRGQGGLERTVRAIAAPAVRTHDHADRRALPDISSLPVRRTGSPCSTLYPVRSVARCGLLWGHGSYLVVNSVEHIRALTTHFDRLIHIARYGPDRVTEKISELIEALETPDAECPQQPSE